MRNWFELAIPHEDIRKGDFDESVFAADLGDVAIDQATNDYNDPYIFYKKTYLTDGLTQLLHQVHDRLALGKGPGVLELKTPFGGGKTHALISLYHYLKNGEQIQSLLPEGIELIEPSVATLVGTQLNPAEGESSQGVTRHTLWGELAFQLGGKAAYGLVKENDASRIAPGKALLRRLLEPQRPFVLLFDEVLEYVNRARGVAVKDTTLATQTRAFFQELTETVASLDNSLMIVTLPSSELEDFEETEEQSLRKLDKIFGRIESITTTVQDEEVYAIIRKRLFEPMSDESEVEVKDIVNSYAAIYHDHKDELPVKVREADYRRKLETAYPFHPDVIDILYEKWGTFSSFQRTRGVLRLLATVIEDLYQREKNINLILPGDVNLNYQPVRNEFLKHIGPEYESIIGSDITKSQQLDRENKGWKHIAERIVTAIFVHSFAADEPHKGISLPYIKLAVMRPETIPPLVTEVLGKQANELWYLNTRGDEYYISDVPNLNRMVLDRKQTLRAEVRPELKRRIKQELGDKFRSYLWPQSANEIPNNRDLKLIILDPENAPSLDQLTGWLEKAGSSFRVYKNTLFFALPDSDRYLHFQDAIREFLALEEIDKEVDEGQQPGLKEKKNELKRRIRSLQDDFPLQVRELYRTVAVPVEGNTLEIIDLGKPTIGTENLDSWYWKELTDAANMRIISRPPSARMLSSKFLSTSDAISLSKLLEQFYKDTSLPALSDQDVLAESMARTVRDGQLATGIGSADDIRPSSIQFEDDISSREITFDEDRFLLTPERAENERAKQKPRPPGTTPRGPEEEPPTGEPPTPTPPKPGEETVSSYRCKAKRIPVSKIADLNRGVFAPLRQQVGDFEITVEIDVNSDRGISKHVIEQQVEETLRQLGAEIEEES